MTRLLRDLGDQRLHCFRCGTEIPPGEEAWIGDQDGFCCADCDSDEWAEATDVCKFGGPAPCIDDVCHALGGCMHYGGGA